MTNKKNLRICILALLVFSLKLNAQNTYPWPQFGNVGIGTTSAVVPLEVVVSNISDIPSVFRYGPNSQNLFFSPYVAQGGFNPITVKGDMGIFWNDQVNQQDNSNAAAGLVIAPKHGTKFGMRMDALGHTGFGISDPHAVVHIKSDVQKLTQENLFTPQSGFISETSNPYNVPLIFSMMARVSNDNDMAFVASNTGNNTIPFIVYGSGTTIIGQHRPTGTHSDALLSVDGKLLCKSLYVTQLNWADDVFSEGYKLAPWETVREFYTSNKRLPGVPSEASIKDQGNNVAETDAIFLRKLEEAYLYIDQVKKENELLKKEIKEIKQAIRK